MVLGVEVMPAGRAPLFCAAYCATALEMASTSERRWVLLACWKFLVGLMATKTMASKTDSMPMTMSNSMRVKPDWRLNTFIISMTFSYLTAHGNSFAILSRRSRDSDAVAGGVHLDSVTSI